jgi:hypothetical protein
MHLCACVLVAALAADNQAMTSRYIDDNDPGAARRAESLRTVLIGPRQHKSILVSTLTGSARTACAAQGARSARASSVRARGAQRHDER